MSNDLIDNLLKSGLIQFGRFGENHAPLKLNFELLPSYPNILSQIIHEVKIIQPVERFLCTANSLPFAMVLSQKHQIPLAYSQGSPLPGAYGIVGAYDVGHPTAFITSVWENVEQHHHLIQKAKKVGLHINQIITIVDYGIEVSNQIETHSILQLDELVKLLIQSGKLPSGQAAEIKKWLSR